MTKGLCSPLQLQQKHQQPLSPLNSDENDHKHHNQQQRQQDISAAEDAQYKIFGDPSGFDLKPSRDHLATASTSSSAALAPHLLNRPMPICTHCSLPIADPFILRVHPDLEFHLDCLKCAECGRPLDEHCSAFVRDGKTFCRDDYFRLFRRCPRCNMLLQPTDMVMKARHLVFHMNCFSCVNCQRMLMPGEQFLLRQDELFCRDQCFMLQQQQFHLHLNGHPHPPMHPPLPDFSSLQTPLPPPPPMTNGSGGTPPYELVALGNGTGGGGVGQQQQQNGGGGEVSFMERSSAFAHPSGGVAPPVQATPHCQPNNCPSVLSQLASSGASPLSFSNPDESLTPSSTNASTPTASNGCGPPMGQFGHPGNFDPCGGTMGGGGGAGAAQHFVSSAGGSNCSSSSGSVIVHKGKKSKKDKPAQRVRTVLNETQLKILKQTYNMNQRPDTVTKEHLVERTGLNARVIRVWFQNKRCKDKKRQIEQREKQQSQEKDQTIRSVRISGMGPMTASSPGPVHLDQQQQQQFPAPVEIRQFSQNPRLWNNEAGAGMDGNIHVHPAPPPPPMDSPFHLNASIMMPNGPPGDFLHPSNPNFAPLPNGMQMFSQHALSE